MRRTERYREFAPTLSAERTHWLHANNPHTTRWHWSTLRTSTKARYTICWGFYAMHTYYRFSSTVNAGPRIRMHASCVRKCSRKSQGSKRYPCCRLCGDPFIPGHPKLCELVPFNCEAFDQRLPPFEHPFGPDVSKQEVEKAKRTKKPRKTRRPVTTHRT